MVDRADEFLVGFPSWTISLMRLVQHCYGPQHLEYVEQAVLDRAAVGIAFQIRMFVQQAGIAQHVIAVRE
jgi:hypothetical protein